MSEDDIKQQKQRIHRLIRDLNIRYIKGSIGRRTYQTLKQKYQTMLENLPERLAKQEIESAETKSVDIQISEIREDIEDDVGQEIVEKDLPEISLTGIPNVAQEEFKLRYVMHLALKASSNIFEQELELEKEYLAGHLSNKEYLDKKNLLETKQHKIFQNYYKLSDTLFNLTKKHIFKRTHNNFLLFTNELSENLNRLRGQELDKYEIKGVIYEINNLVLKHRPILKKGIEEAKKWKHLIIKEREKFAKYVEQNEKKLTQSAKDNIERKIRQLTIYIDLIEEDINDYEIDLEALEQVYGEHLQYQEMASPYFANLEEGALKNIRRYNHNLRFSFLFQNGIDVTSSVFTRSLNYQFLTELNSLWKYMNTPVLDENKDLIGFLIGPGKLEDDYGVLIHENREISLSMIRRIYDYIIAPNRISDDIKDDKNKKLYILNEIPKILPVVPFSFLIPDVIIEYCKKQDYDLSDDLLEYMKQSKKILFIPIEQIEKDTRMIIIKTDKFRQGGSLLPNFDLKKSNDINKLLLEKNSVPIKDVFGKKLGTVHSIVSHPRKGYFIIIKKESIDDSFYGTIYDLLFSKEGEQSSLETIDAKEKKWRLLLNLSRQYNKSETEVAETSFLKKVLVEKNTGFLPQDVENLNYSLYSIGNVRIVGNALHLSYSSPSFDLNKIFDLEGKVVENVKGKELGVVYNLLIDEKPAILIWSKIDLFLIASFINKEPRKILKDSKNFIDNLAISIGKYLSLAPQLALRPDNVITFMNLIGKIDTYDEIKKVFRSFEPMKIELSRIISIDESRVLVDLSEDKTEESREITESAELSFEEEDYVTSPDYYLEQ